MGAFTMLIVAVLTVLAAEHVEGTKLTYYWVAFEKELNPQSANDKELATCAGATLAKTNKRFADQIAMEGSGYLRDEKTVLNLGSCVSGGKPCRPNNSGKYSCFIKVSAPMGSRGNALVSFVSIATNDGNKPFGSTYMVQEFKGKKLPNGETHDGCVRVDDTCSTCNQGDWIDFYVLREKHYNSINSSWKLSSVTLAKSGCTPKRYNIR